MRALASLILIATLAACARRAALLVDAPSGVVTLDPKETLRILYPTDPSTLDFQKMSDAQSAEVVVNLMDSLVEYGFRGDQIELRPGLALSWTPRERARKWTLRLRPGVKWTDGVAFTGQQVIDGWRRLLDPKTAAQYAYYLFPLKNARAFNAGKQIQISARAVDDLTIDVELERPLGYFPQLLTHHSTLPVRLDLIAKFGDRWTEPGALQTLGPYRLLAWRRDKLLAMERNERYWGERAKIKFIAARIVNESSTAVNLFDAGQIDALNALPLGELRTLRKLKEFRSSGSLLTWYYGLNVRKAPLNNVYVRQALARAIDRGLIVRALGAGQKELGSVLPPGVLGYDDSIGPRFDPAGARRLLARGGFPDASRFPRLTLKINSGEEHQKVAENVQAQLRANLGIDVEIQAEDYKAFLAGLRTDAAPIFRWGWLADYPDPDNFLAALTGASENNHMGWKNAEFDSLVERAASETEVAKRRDLYRSAQRLLVERETPVIPLYAGIAFFLINDRVKNYPVNPLRRYRYNQTDFVE